MFEHFEYLSLTQLSKVFLVEVSDIGQILQQLGLRHWDTECGAYVPSDAAIKSSLTKQVHAANGSSFYSWHRERTIAALTEAGLRLPEEIPPAVGTERKLHGPYSTRETGMVGCEIVNGDGTVAIWVAGSENAKRIAGLLNKDDQGTFN